MSSILKMLNTNKRLINQSFHQRREHIFEHLVETFDLYQRDCQPTSTLEVTSNGIFCDRIRLEDNHFVSDEISWFLLNAQQVCRLHLIDIPHYNNLIAKIQAGKRPEAVFDLNKVMQLRNYLDDALHLTL